MEPNEWNDASGEPTSDATGERPSEWHKVLEPEELSEGRVSPVVCGHRNLCMTRFEGRYGALDARCPHQGGPLGEGSIENGWLRCPWHGFDYHPITGRPPGGFDDAVPTFPVEERADGVYVGLPEEAPAARTVSDAMIETMERWGVRWVFGMVGHSNLHVADAVRRRSEHGPLRYVAIRHEGAASFAASAYGKLTGVPAACLAIAGPGATNLLTGLWDAHVDRSSGAGADRPGRDAGAGHRRLSGGRPRRRLRRRRRLERQRAAGLAARGADGARLEERGGPAGRGAPDLP
ncbi:MAG: thiamine pyrophosphate-binding protein [Trueperaceae bacterium]|nr:thiamine pyrophosphate-binding protein [Trueperaceae bacterium]